MQLEIRQLCSEVKSAQTRVRKGKSARWKVYFYYLNFGLHVKHLFFIILLSGLLLLL